MDIVTALFTGIAAFFAAVIIHFVAHDAYEQSPRYAERLIKWAVQILPINDRLRYQEEWLADLFDHKGAIAKLRHALGCLLCAYSLSRICKPQASAAFVLTVDGSEKITTNLATGIWLLAIFKAVLSGNKLSDEELEKLAVDTLARFRKELEIVGEPHAGDMLAVSQFFHSLANGTGLADKTISMQIKCSGQSFTAEELIEKLDWPKAETASSPD